MDKFKYYDILINENCTLDCTFCCLGKKSHKIIDINNLLHMLPQDYVNIHIAGEPLASIKSTKTLYTLLNHLHGMNYTCISMTTNLVYELTDTRLACLNLVDKIKTSFNIKHRFGNIHNLLLWRRNVRRLARSKYIEIIVSLDKYTLRAHNPAEYDSFFRSLGNKLEYRLEYRYVPYIPYGNGDHEDLQPTKEEFRKFIKDSTIFRSEFYKDDRRYISFDKRNLTDDYYKTLSCNYCTNSDGRVTECIDTDCNIVTCLMDKECKVPYLIRTKEIEYICPHLCYLLDEGEDILKIIVDDIDDLKKKGVIK